MILTCLEDVHFSHWKEILFGHVTKSLITKHAVVVNREFVRGFFRGVLFLKPN